MLILAVKQAESIQLFIPPSHLGRIVTVKVNDTRSNVCRLAFEAPRDIEIVRTELLTRKESHGHAVDGTRTKNTGPVRRND